jgi:hypothetical protein
MISLRTLCLLVCVYLVGNQFHTMMRPSRYVMNPESIGMTIAKISNENTKTEAETETETMTMTMTMTKTKTMKTTTNDTQEQMNTHTGIKTSSDINKNIVIQMRFPRKDRLGSNINRPLYLMGYAHCYRQWFCIEKGREGLANYFPGFETCPDGLDTTLAQGDMGWANEQPMFDHPINRSGVYSFRRGDKLLRHWMDKNQDCAFDDVMRRKWRKMILDASFSSKISNKTLVEEELFETTDDPNVVTVAINIRRGDFIDWGRFNLVPDQIYVIMLRQLRSILEKAGKSPEVHLFSEDYGLVNKFYNITTNWTLYNGLVEHFHLAKDMRHHRRSHVMDMDLNLRDWRHFIQADILIVGGTFSATPALGRPKYPDPKTGLPLTINRWSNYDRESKTMYKYDWSTYKDYGYMPDQFQLINLPKVFAKHDTVPMEAFFEGITYNNHILTHKNKIAFNRKKN